MPIAFCSDSLYSYLELSPKEELRNYSFGFFQGKLCRQIRFTSEGHLG